MFEDTFVHARKVFDITACHFKQINGIEASVTIYQNGKEETVVAMGNGRLDAISNALKDYFKLDYVLSGYEQHALTSTSRSQAMSYVSVQSDNVEYWGAGIDEDIIKSSYKALTSAVNNLLTNKGHL